MNGTWGHYAKWNKPDQERQILHGKKKKKKRKKKVKPIETGSKKVVAKMWQVWQIGWGW